MLFNARKRMQDTYRVREGACPGVSGMATKCTESTLSMFRVYMYCVMRI